MTTSETPLAFLSAELLDRLEQGDLAALISCDCRGLLVGSSETAADYRQRLQCLQTNIIGMETALAETGHYSLEGMHFQADERIGSALFAQVQAATQALYGFAIDWVPGFFVDPRYGWLFGGAAFYFYPDFFALFIIRRSFRDQERWLIYNRSELLAHELCHVARVGLESMAYEESLAYATSHSRFRHRLGGMFHRARDSFMLLGSTLTLLAAQIVQLHLLPSLPIWPFWLGVLGCVGYLGARHGQNLRRLRRAAANVGGPQPMAVLFRCTDPEIHALAACASSQAAAQWMQQQAQQCLRWRVILARFGPAAEPNLAP